MHIEPTAPYNELPLLPPREELETPAVMRACITARAALGELKQSQGLLPNPSDLGKAFLVLEACASCAMGGEEASADELFRHAVAGKMKLAGVDGKAMQCHAALLDGWIAVRSRYPLGLTASSRVCSLVANRKASVRTHAASHQASSRGTVVYTPPSDPRIIRDLLANWESYLREDGQSPDPLVRMAVAHFQFEAIQPFTTGTARTARVLDLLYLVERGLLDEPVLHLSRSLLARRKAYLRSLAMIVKHRQWEEWILLVLKATADAARWTQERAAAVHKLAQLTGDQVAAAVPAKAGARLNAVLFGMPYCRIQQVMDAVGCSRITATKYLRELCRINVLSEQRTGRDALFANVRYLKLMLSDQHELDVPLNAVNENARSASAPAESPDLRECDTILFDINETVLDLSELRGLFAQSFGEASVASLWFAILLHSSVVCALTGVRAKFADLAGNAIDSLAARKKVAVTSAQRADILGSFASLKPHADVAPALERLREAGLRTAAFSNSSLELAQSQVANAGLSHLFDAVISVEETGSFKPDPAVYRFAADRLERSPDRLLLIAAHDWDTHGAMSVGLNAAYIDRTGAPYHPLYRKPEIMATDIGRAAALIIAGRQAEPDSSSS